MTQYLIRFDDLYVGMERKYLYQVKECITKQHVPAILGVVPDWRDKNQVQQPVGEQEFWSIIKELQAAGCEIALHGFHHTLFEHPNILNVNKYGEFAGLPFAEQTKRLTEGKRLLETKGVTCRLFMAPAHSFDKNTLKALTSSGFTYITDGKSLYPYSLGDVICFPQIASEFKNYPIGLITVCLHPQWMTSSRYQELYAFVSKNAEKVISFADAIQVWENLSLMSKILDRAFRIVYSGARTLKQHAKKFKGALNSIGPNWLCK